MAEVALGATSVTFEIGEDVHAKTMLTQKAQGAKQPMAASNSVLAVVDIFMI